MPHIDDVPPLECPTLEPIAICGMACRLPGQIDSPSSFWDLLVQKGSAHSERVPKSRFNIDAHYHKNLERPGSFNVLGGYFLDGPAENFDPTFFNMSPVEAMWLDPQQRKTLEVCYEAIEAAGLTLDSIAGSNTAVFVGSFTADYQQMTFRDPDFRHSYAATGVDPGIISNRIGSVFDLKGPSFTINTACSSSIYAVHNACHALRAKDCDAALVGGVNLILTVDQHLNTAKLGIMSPTSFCHTFDASADGYGRAEGAGALYLKRLSDAVRDGDVIRAAIRSSAVNTNGKVPGYGITNPSAKGQEAAIRAAYKKAKLDPNETAYFECHGTGTPVGDPIEVRAVANAMNDTRAFEKPLLIGAVKPNIGHSEAASGISAIIKAALMVESGIVPGVAGLKTVNPEIPEALLNIKVNKDTALWPDGFQSRRVSVSSFGYGGTNGHVIVEDVRSLVSHYQHGGRKELVSDHRKSRPLLVTFSAHDKATLIRNIQAHANIANQYYLSDLAHTLNLKRSDFSQRAFTVANEDTVTEDMSVSNFKFGSNTRTTSKVAFVFTGQGAQWAGMGREAMRTFPVFRETIQRLDQILKNLTPAPKFSIEKELVAPPETTRLDNAFISQPTLVATQIAIVDLLSSWNVVPVATVGHSAGECGAAYAAGLVSAPEIIIAAYYRGCAIENFGPSGGTMLAVGMGLEEVGPYLARFDEGIVVACDNSPKSVTLSGTVAAIQEAKSIFVAENVFARELRTGMAYHSPQMNIVAGPMADLIVQAYQKLDMSDCQWRCPRKTMISSVTNAPIADGQVGAEYWASNLTSRVLFNSAVSTLMATVGFESIGALVEVGPHSVLAGPLKQIFQANAVNNCSYIPTLLRNQSDVQSLLKTAGELYLRGFPVDLYAVNHIESSISVLDLKALGTGPSTLVDLPPYQWNYEKTFWTEPRVSAELRQPSHARHDLLGRRIPGLSDHFMAWRNILRIKDIPWLQDHKLGGSIMFPTAGYMALAIEGATQHCEVKGVRTSGMVLRGVNLKTALIIPETDAGIEIQLRLSQTSASFETGPTYNFSVETYANSVWTIHSEGTIVPVTATQGLKARPTHPVNINFLSQRHTGKRWNDAFRRIGFEYGPSFNSLNSIRTHEKYHQAASRIPLTTTLTSMTEESRYILHPSTVDCLLQLGHISIHAGLYQDMPWGVVPTSIEEVTFFPLGEHSNCDGEAVAWNSARGERARHFNTNMQLATPAGNIILDIKGMHTVAYEAALPPRTEPKTKPRPYAGVVWKPDLALSFLKETFCANLQRNSAVNAVLEMVDLLNHKQPFSSILVLDSSEDFQISPILRNLPTTAVLHLAQSVSETADVSPATEDGRVKRFALPEASMDLESLGFQLQDLIIIGHESSSLLVDLKSWSSLKPSISTQGKALVLMRNSDLSSARGHIQKSGLSSTEISFEDETLVVCSPAALTNRYSQETETVNLVYARRHCAAPRALADAISDQDLSVRIKEIEEVDLLTDKQILLYDPSANLLARPEPASFEALKEIISSGRSVLWLTEGLNEGKCASAALAQGFLRVAREEQKMSKLSLLDVDQSETHDSIARSVAAILAPSNHTASMAEHEYWLQNGTCKISRIVFNKHINDRMITTDEDARTMPLPSREPLRAVLDGSNITFRRNDVFERQSIGVGEVEIQVECIEVLKQDLQAEIEGPRLVSGEILDVGETVDPNLRGRTVVAYTSNPHDTIVRVADCMYIESERTTAKSLVYALPDLCRAIHAMQCIAGPVDEQHILLLPTSESLVRCFARLSETQGFKLTMVRDRISAPETKVEGAHMDVESACNISDVSQIHQLLEKVDRPVAIMTEDFSPFCQELWRKIPSNGCFVTYGNQPKNLPVAPDVNVFSRGAWFCVTNMALSFEKNPASLGKILQRAMSIIKDQVGDFVKESSVISVNTLEKASKSAVERSILAYGYGTDVVKVMPSKYHVRFSSEDVYLLVGCLGGLGRSLTYWMMDRGARHFAFISRSGADKPEAAQLVEAITESGAVANVFRGDASNVNDVSRVVETITSERRIKGLVHAAMVLEDGMIGPKMTVEKFKAALTPKMDGVQILHDALQGHDLDFFVMTSSISGTVGQPGQSNYAAANSFLDNFAWQRNLKGLPATSLVLPMITGIGVVAENDFLEDKITRRGMYGIDEREMLRGFEAAMSQPMPDPKALQQCNSTIILGLEPSRLGIPLAAAGETTDISWYEDARFSALRPLIDAAIRQNGNGDAGKSGPGGDFAGNVAAVAASQEGYSAALAMTAKHIMQKCASILMMAVEDFQLEGHSIGNYGLDSMIGAELRNWLFKEFRFNIAFQDLLASTLTFNALSMQIVESLTVK